MPKINNFFQKYSQFQGTRKILLGAKTISWMSLSKKTHHSFNNLMGTKKVLLFATGCSVKAADFRNEIPDVVLKRLKITFVSCGHKGRIREIDCLQAAVQGRNQEGYYVAVQEKAEIDALQQLERVPVICCQGKQIHLKQQSKIQEEFAEAEAEAAPGLARRHGLRH